jgi:putative transcriptional regulator
MAGETSRDLSASILVATPALHDPNFRRTILFVASHSASEGAVAYVLNRPLGSAVDVPGASDVALHYGGPVEPHSVLVASLQWRPAQHLVAFRIFEDEEITPEWKPGLRAFAGYAGWSPGQLEHEIRQQAWMVLAPSASLIELREPLTVWDQIMADAPALMRLLAAAPEDPQRN